MSLINEALKQAQKTLSSRTLKPTIANPLFKTNSTESKGKTKSFLFLVTLATVFGAALIMLLVLLFAPKHTPIPQTKRSSTLSHLHAIDNYGATAAAIHDEYSLQSETLSQAVPAEPNPSIADTPSATATSNPAIAPTKSLNEDLLQSIMEMASKALTHEDKANAATKNTTTTKTQTVAPQDDLTLPAAAITLKRLTHQARMSQLAPVDPITHYMNSLSITGLMFAGTDSKVLMNNQMYGLNAIVHTNPNLYLAEINPHEIVLIDESGTQYRKQL